MLRTTSTIIATCSFLLIFLTGSIGHASDHEFIIRYPQPESEDDTRDAYKIELLRLALEKTKKTEGAYNLIPSDIIIPTNRLVTTLQEGKQLSVLFSATTLRLESQLRPIRIPVLKGILGYRIFLIRKQDKEKFDSITTLDELKKYTVGQGLGWRDIDILKENGFPVVTGGPYEGLFLMLTSGRFDYFSRGVIEALVEHEERKEKLPTLFVEEKLLIHYPFPVYFFVARENTALANRIERGLNMMINDGSFDELFNKHHQALLEKANIKNRRIFKINNPLLPQSTNLDRVELWYSP